MTKKRQKLALKPKAIPHRFMKRRGPPLTEILPAGAYHRRIKELLKNNKELASALQVAKCAVADNERTLQDYAKHCNNVLLAKHKMKNMATTIQKLVVDLHDVSNLLENSHSNSFRAIINTDDVRLNILEPNLETIKESPRPSLETYAEESGDESSRANITPEHCQNSPSMYDAASCSELTTPVMDTDATEIYNVNNFLGSCFQLQKDFQPIRECSEDVAMTPVNQTPPTPQFDPSLYVSKLTELEAEKPTALTVKERTSKTAEKSTFSKIPIRRPNLFHDSDYLEAPKLCRETFFVRQNSKDSVTNKREILDVAEPQTHKTANADRRGTFVLPALSPPKSAYDRRGTFVLPALSPPKSAYDRRGTFVLSVLPQSKPDSEKRVTVSSPPKSESNGRGTFVVPDLPPPKPDPKPANVFELPREICTDDQTMLQCVDMDLTDVIPSIPFQHISRMLGNTKNTVAILERDIGIAFQEQSRRKRSLKRRVSFANKNANSDCEDEAEREIEEEPKVDKDIKKTNAPVRRSILKKSILPVCLDEKDLISPENSFSNIDAEKVPKADEDVNKKSVPVRRSILKKSVLPTCLDEKDLISPKNLVSNIDAEKVPKADEDINKKSVPVRRSILKKSIHPTCLNEKDLISPENSFSNVDSDQNSDSFEIKLIERGSDKKSARINKISLKKSSSQISNNENGAASSKSEQQTQGVEDCIGEALEGDDIDDESSKKTTEFPGSPLIASPLAEKARKKSSIKSRKKSLPKLSNGKSRRKAEVLGLENKAVKSCNSKTPKSKKSSNSKAKKKTECQIESDILTEVKDSLNYEQSGAKKLVQKNSKTSASPLSKARKTNSIENLKENIIPELESEGRSRRSRPTMSFKEPSLHKKMRRE